MHRTSRFAPFLLVFFLLASAASAAQSEEIRWRGSLGGLEFFVTFTPAAGGSGYTATMDIPAQGLSGGALTDVVYADTEIAFTLLIAPPSGATWRATRGCRC